MGFKDINKDIIEEIGDVESDDCEHEEVEVVVMTDKKVDEEEKKIRTIQSRVDTTLQCLNIWMNLNFIKLQNYKFENMSSFRIGNFLSLNLSLEMSWPNFGSINSSISRFIEFEFLKSTNHVISLKFESFYFLSFK